MEYILVQRPALAKSASKKAENEGKEKDQRSTNRRPVTLWVIDQTTFSATQEPNRAASQIIDLSESGAFLTSKPIQLNTEIQIHFVLPNRLAPLQATGRVVWSTQTKFSQGRGQTSGIGVEFTAISGDDQSTLKNFLQTWDWEDSQRFAKGLTEAPPLPLPTSFSPGDAEIELLLENGLGN